MGLFSGILTQQAGFDVLTASTILFSIKESAIKLPLPQKKLLISQFKNIQVILVNGSKIMLRVPSAAPQFLVGQFWVHNKTVVTLITEKRVFKSI